MSWDDNDLEEWGRNEAFEDTRGETDCVCLGPERCYGCEVCQPEEEPPEEDPCTCNAPGGYCNCPGAPRAPSIWER